MDAQMKRGMLEICVLSSLQRKDSYGYQMVKDLSACVDISESTLYPLLKRLEAAGCVTVYSLEHNGRLRKLYHLTSAGRRRIEDFLNNWQEINTIYNFIREGYQND